MYLIPFVSRYYSSSETWSSVSRYLVLSRYWWTWFTRSCDITSSWPSHMLASYIDVILPSGPLSISLSHGWTNSDLDPYASTHSFGIPKKHLYNHPVTVWHLMSTKQPPEMVIKYDLMVKGLGYFVFLIIAMMNFMTWSHCNTYVGWCPSYHSPNDMIPLSIDINVHDRETSIIGWPMS